MDKRRRSLAQRVRSVNYFRALVVHVELHAALVAEIICSIAALGELNQASGGSFTCGTGGLK